jgi:PAS domain-containing protein
MPDQHSMLAILFRRVGDLLNVPMLLVDAQRRVVFYNEPAEDILGRPSPDHAEPVSLDEWLRAVVPGEEHTETSGSDCPIEVALDQRRPARATMKWRGADGATRRLAVIAVPLDAQDGRLEGAVAFGWDMAPVGPSIGAA